MSGSDSHGEHHVQTRPAVRGQELDDELRPLRESAELTPTDAASRIDASASKLSRIESGLCGALAEDVAALLAVYAVTGDKRRELPRTRIRQDGMGCCLRQLSHSLGEQDLAGA